MTPKTIAINTRFLIKGKLEGIGRFTKESLQRITQNHPEHDFVFLFDRTYDSSYIFGPNVKGMSLAPPARHPFLWYAWFEYSVPRALKKIQPDVFVSTDGYLSLKADVPSVVVLHDLGFEHYPHHVPNLVGKYYRHYTPKFAQKATRIATVSEYTKQDVAQRYQVALDKIDVVYNGGSEEFQPLSDTAKEKVKKTYTQGCDYFLFVGAIHPRKNVGNLFKAYDAFRKSVDTDVKLLIVGRKAWDHKEIFDIYNQMQYKEEVIFLGHIQIDELAKITAAALAQVYASLFEGFGIPILEAMCCDVPVITSTVSSMPEVAGEAAILVNPTSYEEIAQAMQAIHQDLDLRQELIQKGQKQRQVFSWDKTADRFWRCIEKALMKN